ncbi:protein SUPPRESSOR OF PHYA-105 1-like isoform X2 [Abrus precatorius]|uniref:Protein SUPPRESSOR OF PHYA-105 1-like isoform X2 n=1 Tax=Abrus precatorius TaxID=3816 RepID=A0A8B8JZS7_ABRPR|nr:protein SUPPRESSOR OF PHYA-105 1-like isoform X2 [Abrus precatorius]XP_027336753.1 protein SUPPRESSOR OF PHYA-105 1-like isoform X2 [Abrus precatorius]XP_027336754.1 protein SUPPRESSOR OF PHYA-105 1-like isoform X2 [Abrus precatorius]XP_027336755.1 protein SUPPRESSOR OF PHYA-105 1-like isoform X2 [Abrus precatorius]
MTTANGGAGTEEHKRKTNDPFLKSPGHQNMPKSPRLCTPIRKEWPESLPNDNTIGNEDNGLNRYVTSLAGSGPPGTNFCSTIDSEHIVEELPVRNYKNQNIDVVNHPHNSRQPLRNQLAIESKYNSLSREIVPKVELQIPLKLSKGLKGIDSEIWGLKSLPLKVSADISNRNKTITSSNAHLNSSKTHNTLSAYNCPQLVAEQTVKGKGVICKDLDKNFGLGGVLMSQEDEKPAFATKLQHDTLLRPNVVDNNPSLKETAVMCAESSNDALNLREWIKSEDHIMKKSVRLQIFKQILEMVDFAHSQGNVLKDLKPSCFSLLPSSKIKYIGSYGHRELDNEVMKRNVTWKRPLEQDIGACQSLSTKQQKLCEETGSFRQQHHFTCIHGSRTMVNQTDSDTNGSMESRNKESLYQNDSSHQCTYTDEKQYMSVTIQLEDKWYCSPEVLNGGPCTFSSNIYSLGVLLFELLCNIESWEAHSTMMLDLSCRILPPKFLSENPKEAGFCLWLLHPEPSSRPITRMILESEFICESEESSSGEDVVVSDDDETETEQLIHFLISLKEEKKKQAAKLEEQLNCLNEDIKGVERSYSFGIDSVFHIAQMNNPELRGNSLHFQDSSISDINTSIPRSFVDEERFMSNINQLENSYFSTRFKVLAKEASAVLNNDKNVVESRWRLSHVENVNKEPRGIQNSVGCLGSFFEGLWNFARYSKFEECGTLRNRDLLSSANVMCALSFDRDEDHIAAGGVSKKIKIFDLNSISSDSIDIQYPVVEMSNKSKLSCVCWNSYIKNHLASTDYDGVVQMWDADTGQPLSQYMEHQKRAWSVHFSLADPKMFASGSDDCSVKLWNISERNSMGTIWNPANICCVQFSAYSTNLLFFGSADYKVYGYDLRHTRIPWCTLSGHGKAVSYVKFIDAETVVSASTDNSLKLWDLNKTSSSALSSDACVLTFKGHSNEKNFVGLSVLDGYIACGSESNEVYCYHKSLPVPIATHKFESIDSIYGHPNSGDNRGQFVSSVCWRKKSNMLVAANSVGIVKLLQMV